MSRESKPPAAVLSRGSVSTEFDGKTYTGSYIVRDGGKTYTGSYVVRDDTTVEVLCRYGHRWTRTPQSALGSVEPQDGFAEQLLKEILWEAAQNGRLDPAGTKLVLAVP